MKRLLILLISIILIFSTISGCLENEDEDSNVRESTNNIPNKNKNSEDNDTNEEETNNNTNDEENVNVYDSELTTEPLLYKIQKNNTESYLYGTIHLNQDNILTLPDVVVNSLITCDNFYSEIKLDAETYSQSASQSILENETLDDILPYETAQRLYTYLEDIGLNSQQINILKSYKVWAIVTSLSVLENQLENPTSPSLDQYLWNTAFNQNIKTGGLETVAEQTKIFDNLSLETQIEYLNETLDYIDEYEELGKDPIDEVVDHYINGDLKETYEYSLSDYDENDSIDVKLKKQLYTNRNYNFTDRIIDNITKHPDESFFFAIGCAHFYGEEGVIQLLEKQGFNVSRVKFEKSSTCAGSIERINERCYYPYENSA